MDPLSELIMRGLASLQAQTPMTGTVRGTLPPDPAYGPSRPAMGGYMASPMPALPVEPPMKPMAPVNLPPQSAPAPGAAPAGLLSAPPSPGAAPPAGTPQPISPLFGAPQAVSPLVGGGALPELPSGGLQAAGQEDRGFLDFLAQPELARGLMEMGAKMLAASAPSTDPRSGSLGYALGEGIGGLQSGMDDVREQKRQERNDAVNEAYKMAIAAGDGSINLQKFYDENGRETYGYWDAGEGRMVQVGGSKVEKSGGGGGGSGPGAINTKGLPKGYMWGTDPMTGQPMAVPIPGIGAAGTAGAGAGGPSVVIEDIDRAIEKINSADLPTTGLIGGVLSAVPGTTAYDVDALITTIKANAGFDRLQAMRNASPTGGALGAVSERELTYLQSTIGNLSQSQSKEQLLENLQRVKQAYLEIIHGPGGGASAASTGGSTVPPQNRAGTTSSGVNWSLE